MSEEFKTTPYAHQLEAYLKHRDDQRFALFADMGVGKSKIAIDVACHKFRKGDIDRVLVIAPNEVHTQWSADQFPTHCALPYKDFVWHSSTVDRNYVRSALKRFMEDESGIMRVFVVNVEAFQSTKIIPYIRDFVQGGPPFIIVDEATRIKSPTAKRSKMIRKLNKYGYRTILTGTPVTRSPFDLWAMFEFLEAGYFDCNYHVFQHRYGVMMKGMNPATGVRYTTVVDEKTWNITRSKIEKMAEKRGGKLMPNDFEEIAGIMGLSTANVRFIETHPQFTKFKRLDDLRELIAPDTYSIRKEDCLDLPEKVFEQILVDLSPKQKRVYTDLKQNMLIENEGMELSVANKAALLTRLMQVCGGFIPMYEEQENSSGKVTTKEHIVPIEPNNKMNALLDDLEEADGQIIVWARFRAELKTLYYEIKKRGYEARLYFGDTEVGERKRIISAFQAGDVQVFIGNPAVAGFGLNLQVSTLQYFYSNSFRVEDRLQAEDRSHRIGVKSTCVYKDIVLRNTVDEMVYDAIRKGRDLNDYFKSKELRELLEE